ncbi:MAG: hypothetical protein H0W28_12320 [Pyrinomonadaceae bacterium]|nr:hypothetical protein [Pyrinomonadaceae bacterium]
MLDDLILYWSIESLDIAERQYDRLIRHVLLIFDITHVNYGNSIHDRLSWYNDFQLVSLPASLTLSIADFDQAPLLYLFLNTMELHVPEAWLFSGDFGEDRSRLEKLACWSADVGDEANGCMVGMEWDGDYHALDRTDSIALRWKEYANSTYERIDASAE